MTNDQDGASAGHKLGQLIGDWFEEYFVIRLLNQVGNELDLYADSRFKERTVRPGKILWRDVDGNTVDYDGVLELGGTDTALGVPVAFFECFWRRGSRHSKDKARDDSGKLMPMRDTYPTARFLGIVAAGDFTGPARELIRSRDIDLFYIPKQKIVQSFTDCGLEMDYADQLDEAQKREIAKEFENAFNKDAKQAVLDKLISIVGQAEIDGYVGRVKARLSSLPQEIRFKKRQDSQAIVFDSIEGAREFLDQPEFDDTNPAVSYVYECTFSDGSEFLREAESIEDMKEIHKEIEKLKDHVTNLSRR